MHLSIFVAESSIKRTFSPDRQKLPSPGRAPARGEGRGLLGHLSATARRPAAHRTVGRSVGEGSGGPMGCEGLVGEVI